MGMEPKSYYCYIVFNENDRTYNGYTVNLKRRLKQHNGLIKGGARATHNRGPWNFLVVMTSCCWDSISSAMQHEWSIKYPTRARPRPKEYNGKLGRLRSLQKVFQHMESIHCTDVVCYVHKDFIDLMHEITNPFDFVTVHGMDDLVNLQ